MFRILTTNEERLKTLNSMRASHRGRSQILLEDHYESLPNPIPSSQTNTEKSWMDSDITEVRCIDFSKKLQTRCTTLRVMRFGWHSNCNKSNKRQVILSFLYKKLILNLKMHYRLKAMTWARMR